MAVTGAALSSLLFVVVCSDSFFQHVVFLVRLGSSLCRALLSCGDKTIEILGKITNPKHYFNFPASALEEESTLFMLEREVNGRF